MPGSAACSALGALDAAVIFAVCPELKSERFRLPPAARSTSANRLVSPRLGNNEGGADAGALLVLDVLRSSDTALSGGAPDGVGAGRLATFGLHPLAMI